MSADNVVLIWKRSDGKYAGYMLFASNLEENQLLEEPEGYEPLFLVDSIEKAIMAAQNESTEYGYSFVNL